MAGTVPGFKSDWQPMASERVMEQYKVLGTPVPARMTRYNPETNVRRMVTAPLPPSTQEALKTPAFAPEARKSSRAVKKSKGGGRSRRVKKHGKKRTLRKAKKSHY